MRFEDDLHDSDQLTIPTKRRKFSLRQKPQRQTESSEEATPASATGSLGTTLSMIPAVGGCGTTTLSRQLETRFKDSLVTLEIGSQQAMPTPPVAFVISANRHGVTTLDQYLLARARVAGSTVSSSDNKSTPHQIDPHKLADLIVIAIEDGLAGERVPRDVRICLKSVNELVPVIVFPRVHDWRQDPNKPASKKYLEKLDELQEVVLSHPKNQKDK